jgi:quercetin dioxygenase-like cupin family protein
MEKPMKIIKKPFSDVPLEGAHDGAGGRRLYVDKGEIGNVDWQAMTYGYLPSKGVFDWHHHDDIDEVMLVLKGTGKVSDEDGEYEYSKGDLFIFPANVRHRIENPSKEQHEYVFVRIATRL